MPETADLQQCCEEMSALYDGNKYAPLAIFLGITEALTMLHHSHHWETQGPTFYADHLLFQRLYEDTQGEIDVLGEKLIGLTNESKLANYFIRIKVIQKFMDMVTTQDPYVVVSLNAEKLYLMIGKFIIMNFAGAGLLTSGLENMLGGILDKHEEHLFLLQNRLPVLH